MERETELWPVARVRKLRLAVAQREGKWYLFSAGMATAVAPPPFPWLSLALPRPPVRLVATRPLPGLRQSAPAPHASFPLLLL